MTQKILVTGGLGFVGSNVVHRLIKDGHNVTVLDNFEIGLDAYLTGLDVEILKGDIRSEDDVTAAVKGKDAVFHLAAYGNVIDSISDPVTNFEINARGTLNMLRAATAHEVGKFVFSSTGGALMGNTPPPVNERSVPKPISPYGASKLACEGYCSAFSEAYGLNTVMFRFANVYGPNSAHKKGVFNRYYAAISEGEPLIVYGNSVRDLIYVDDLVTGLVSGLRDDVGHGEVFHLSTNTGTLIKDLAHKMIDLLGGAKGTITEKPARVGEVGENFAENTLANSRFGFSADTDLHTGLVKTIDWFKTNHNLIQPIKETNVTMHAGQNQHIV